MKQKEDLQSIVALVVSLGVVTVLILLGISILNRFSPSGTIPGQTALMPTYLEGSTITPNNPGTQKAILYETWSSTTNTPEDTQGPFPTGTREGDMVKFSAEKLFLDGLNGWDGYLDGNSVVIYAGSQPEEPEQGAIVILIRLPYRFLSEKVLTPTKHGGVRVIAEQNNRLILQAVDGQLFYFDVPARRFVASLTEVVPTATPPSSLTPTANVAGTPMPTYNPYPLPTERSTEAP